MNLKENIDKMRSFFNEKASTDNYDCVHLKMMSNKIAITEALPDGTKKVFDLGVGTGLELIPLFERFPDAHVTGIDVSESMLETLKKREFADKVTCINGDFFTEDYGTGYDAVISTSALHHFTPEDKLRLFRKAYDSLRDGGMLINSDRYSPDQETEDNIFKAYEEKKDQFAHFDTPMWYENELELLKKAGFKEVNAVKLEYPEYYLVTAVK